jgi:hypothetical protein
MGGEINHGSEELHCEAEELENYNLNLHIGAVSIRLSNA